MRKFILVFSIVSISLHILADIAPYPIEAKGISATKATEIKMVYERVYIDLTIENSYVSCYFKLHNTGKATTIEIGYPNMDVYSYKLGGYSFNAIEIKESGKIIENIRLYKPDSGTSSNNDKPWYIWNTDFKENETKIIEVKYSLPHGNVRDNPYYTFDYLLSTGAGWKDKIDTAEIIVNLNFDKNLILQTMPEGYTFNTHNQIVWNLSNIEPTDKDDIHICYEPQKGHYDTYLKTDKNPIFIIDDTIIISDFDIRKNNKQYAFLSKIEIDDMADIKVIKNTDENKIRFPNLNLSNGAIFIYTKQFVVNKLNQIIKSKHPTINTLHYISSKEFENSYSFKVNGKKMQKQNELYTYIIDNMLKIKDIKVKNKNIVNIILDK